MTGQRMPLAQLAYAFLGKLHKCYDILVRLALANRIQSCLRKTLGILQYPQNLYQRLLHAFWLVRFHKQALKIPI